MEVGEILIFGKAMEVCSAKIGFICLKHSNLPNKEILFTEKLNIIDIQVTSNQVNPTTSRITLATDREGISMSPATKEAIVMYSDGGTELTTNLSPH
jgi:hypothetical protein